ncbi:type II toxin-antitoxin system PemK/MazF family toxin [Patescibacteria group bacterium]|nr:type II toxin-antitoxin system PemK/MazF family toxin [Patescibacteria group bacterium]
MHVKRFLEWIGLKDSLHSKECKSPFVNEGDLWWASLGENVGFEINGKSDKFSRPVIVLRKLSRKFYFVIPTTTQNRKGSWYVPFRQKGVWMVACLHQARAIDYRRLHSKLGRLDGQDQKQIKRKFRELYR